MIEILGEHEGHNYQPMVISALAGHSTIYAPLLETEKPQLHGSVLITWVAQASAHLFALAPTGAFRAQGSSGRRQHQTSPSAAKLANLSQRRPSSHNNYLRPHPVPEDHKPDLNPSLFTRTFHHHFETKMDRLNRMLAGAGGMGGLGAAPGSDNSNLIDNSETVYISSLALLKMLRHGRAGVPMEVMGLMLGEFVDDFTVRVVDVFAMPQSGTGVSVEAVDPVFQQKMMDMLTQTGRPESVVGWYHSHPGFGCWLSSVDISTQQSFEQLTPRAVAVVVDPIQSVKGKVVIDAFRLINPQSLMLGQEPRQSTSNLGHLNKPSIQALIHGLNRHYYSIGINYRKTALEENMLMNLHKHVWTEALEMEDFRHEGEHNKEQFQKLVSLADGYEKRVKEETELTKEQLKTRYVGKLDPKKHLEDVGQQLIEDNIVSVSRQMIDKEATMPKKDTAANGQANGDHMDVEEL
ncbi:putative 26S proteasome regulatory subunit rpn11 [Seiridium cardinale]